MEKPKFNCQFGGFRQFLNSMAYTPSKSEPGPPMDLANMRENGVRSIAVYCLDCNRRADVNVDNFAGDLLVKSFERRMLSRPARVTYEACV